MAWWLLTGLPVVANLPPITDPAVAASARNEILRTALAAGAGVGAAITLALAFRRQRHTEVVADAAKHDATERRVTELYTKAVEQLGHDKAAVRLGGLHALERLAQDTPVLRQTIVDVICAYLRMPFAPPREDSRGNRIRAVQRAARKDGQAPTAMGEILTRNVRCASPPSASSPLTCATNCPRTPLVATPRCDQLAVLARCAP
ncbi:hypothetical protein [Nonomuraea recticatena]|uniref:hypothetical protein n=1 Tax=Nonomuraea recticatena TaxID=46178 RepID=UPI00360AE142